MKRVWALGLAAAVLLAVAGCSKKSEEGATASIKEKIEAKVGAAAPVVELARAWANMHDAKSWRQRMVMEGGQGESQIDVSCPDKEHMTSTMGRQSFESVHIGSDSWARIGGKWMKLPATRGALGMCGGVSGGGSTSTPGGGMSSGGGGEASTKGVTDIFKQLEKSKITVGGMQAVEGATCQEYIVTLAADPASGRNQDINTNICIGVSDHLPRRILMDKMTITYWDWNQPIAINPPM